MPSNRERLAFRRSLHQVEFDLLHQNHSSSLSEIESVLGPLAAPVGPECVEQVRALGHLAAAGNSPGDRLARQTYVEQYGCAGVQRFRTRAGISIYLIEAETFPGHVNNLYLIDARVRLGGGMHDITLLDAGSQMDSTRRDLDRARAVLGHLFGQPGLLDQARHVVISHGHIDHFGGVGEWKQRGVHVYAHPFDARVLTRFGERLIETSVYMRTFMREAGCSPEVTAELFTMHTAEKRMFQPVPVDDELYDGQDFHGMRVHHVPGHCPGQVMLQVDNVLLTADHLLARITPNQSPERITPWTGLDHYLTSLARTRALVETAGIDLALGGHEDPIRRPAERVRETMEFHHQRLRRILELCEADHTIVEICAALFGQQTGYGRLLGLSEAAAHVEYLSRRGYLQIANIEDLLKPEPPAIRYRAVE